MAYGLYSESCVQGASCQNGKCVTDVPSTVETFRTDGGTVMVPLAREGEPCNGSKPVPEAPSCAGDLFCLTPVGASDGTCVTLAHKGEACNNDTHPCWYSLGCVNGVCAAADPTMCPAP